MTATFNGETGACELTVDAGWCAAEGRCVLDGWANADLCGHCDADLDPSALTPGDPDEPTDNVDDAVDFGEVADDTPGQWQRPLSASLAPAADIDFYRFHYGTAASFLRPRALLGSRADADLEHDVCVYIQCDAAADGTPQLGTVVCKEGDTKVELAPGVPGCCAHGSSGPSIGGLVAGPEIAFCNLGGQLVNARATALVTVARSFPPTGPTCAPYEVYVGIEARPQPL